MGPPAQRNAEGTPCKVTAFWDGPVHKSRMEPLDASQGRKAESWRFMESGMMVRCLAKLSPVHSAVYHPLAKRMSSAHIVIA